MASDVPPDARGGRPTAFRPGAIMPAFGVPFPASGQVEQATSSPYS